MKKPVFTWNEEDGSALCVIYDKDKVYYGAATCHPKDKDMMSEKAGCELAYLRAALMGLRSVRDELKAELQGLKKYYYSMNTECESYDRARALADAYGDALVAAGFKQESSSLRTVRYTKDDGSLVCEMDYDTKNRQGTFLNLWFACADK